MIRTKQSDLVYDHQHMSKSRLTTTIGAVFSYFLLFTKTGDVVKNRGTNIKEITKNKLFIMSISICAIFSGVHYVSEVN